jgi:hypothetical protein
MARKQTKPRKPPKQKGRTEDQKLREVLRDAELKKFDPELQKVLRERGGN